MSPGGRIKDSDVETVRERTDIVQLISEYVPLKKSGREFRGPCPFHQEKEPSFYVNPAKGVYFCFGCKASGGVFNFVMQLEGLNFTEAVERLADRIGYQLTYEAASPEQKKARAEKDRLFKLNETAADYYHYLLAEASEGSAAREYLSGRGFEADIIKEFHLGFSPPGWDHAARLLLKKGYSEKDIITAGLARPRTKGPRDGCGIYDIFRNRIMFPISEHRGRVVAFGGRRMPGEKKEGEPKYLNSPETPVYRKGHTLYGYRQDRKVIQEAGEVVVVEGYTDLLALWQAGMKQVVATLGTALTMNHFDLMGRLCEMVFLAFDADRAGIEAAQRPLGFWGKFRAEVMVINLPEGEDPASLVEKGGIGAFEDLKGAAESLLDFTTRKTIEKYDISSPYGRRKAMEACVPILSKVSAEEDMPVRNDLVRKISGWLEVPRETILHYAREAARRRRGPTVSTSNETVVPVAWEMVEREAVRLLLHRPELLFRHLYLDSEYFADQRYENIFGMLKDMVVSDEEEVQDDYNGITRRLVESIDDKELRALAGRLLVEPVPGCEPGFEENVFDRLTYAFFKRRKRKIEHEISRIDKRIEPKKYDLLCDQLLELDQVMKQQFSYDNG